MADPYRRETIAHWVGDFLESPAFRQHPAGVREIAPPLLAAFLEAACAGRDVGPGDVEPADLKRALLEDLARWQVPASARPALPALLGAFLAHLQDQGRLAGGRSLGLQVRALQEAYLAAAGGKGVPLRSAGRKLGRNDPCPCGSGLKYKKCCQGRLD